MKKTIKICAIAILCTSIFWTGLFITYGKAETMEETTELTSVVETTTEVTTKEVSTEEATTECTTESTTVYVAPETTTEIELTTVKYEDVPKLRELGRFYITGYTPTCTHCCGKFNGIGASGRKVVVGESVAMNRTDMQNFGLEYGDKIYIEGIGEREIVDTGCKQGRVDVACDSHESCNAITGYYRVHYVIE